MADGQQCREAGITRSESYVMTFAVSFGERFGEVEQKGNIIERQTNEKNPVSLVLIVASDSLCWWSMATMASKETRSICIVIIGVTSESASPVFHSTCDLLCPPMREGG